MAFIAVPFALLVLWRVPFPGGFYFADGLMIFSVFFLGVGTVYAFGLAIKKPVALRLDHHGISGYFAPTLAWSEIKTVPQKVSSGGKAILLDLHDSKGYWVRQSARAQVMQALNLQAGMVSINISVIKARPEEILEKIRDYHARCAS